MYDNTTMLRLQIGQSTVTDDFTFNLYNAAGALTVSIDSSGDAMMRGTVRTGTTSEDRLEMSGAGFRGITDDGQLSGLVFTPSSLDYWDAYLYHRGTKLVEFYDGVDYFIIRPSTEANRLGIGSSVKPTYAVGLWNFSEMDSCTGLVTTTGDGGSFVTSPSTVDGHTHTVAIDSHTHIVKVVA
jgi:hypothetical protein